MNSTVMTIFNQLIGQYSGSISAIQSGSIVLGKELFNAIALLSVGLLGINRLLRKNIDMVDSNIELIRWLIYLNVFYLFITQYDQFLPLIINSFQQAGTYLGGQASGSYIMPNPAGIISNGFDVGLKILGIGLKQTLFLNLGAALVTVIAVVVILYCFGMIAVELLLIQIGSQIILAGGIFLLAFAGLEWTREYAEHYVHTFFHLGIKMLFMYVLIGIGAGLTNSWAQTLTNIPFNLTFQYDFAIVMATFVFYMICQKLPGQAAVYLTGRMSMNFDAVPSLPDVIKAVAKIPASAVGAAAGIQGMSKAVSLATQVGKSNLESQGKKTSLENIGIAAIKTLGAAKKVEWDKKVDDTKGGKLAKDILDTIPIVKKVVKRVSKKDSQDDSKDSSNDPMEYTI
jgi:type IV secretion system protein TrbL